MKIVITLEKSDPTNAVESVSSPYDYTIVDGDTGDVKAMGIISLEHIVSVLHPVADRMKRSLFENTYPLVEDFDRTE